MASLAEFDGNLHSVSVFAAIASYNRLSMPIENSMLCFCNKQFGENYQVDSKKKEKCIKEIK